jgi:hypothetical protein
MKPTIINAIYACQDEEDSNVSLTINYEALESITDLSGVQRIRDGELELEPFPFTFEDVLLKKDKLIEEWTAQEYARNRASAYDSVGDQLDQLMKDMRDGTTTHQTACEAVKAKFPKP